MNLSHFVKPLFPDLNEAPRQPELHPDIPVSTRHDTFQDQTYYTSGHPSYSEASLFLRNRIVLLLHV